MSLTRRQFIQRAAGGVVLFAVGDRAFGLNYLKPALDVPNPLAAYPARDWEKVYFDQYKYDHTFPWVCSPNCTHACRLDAFVRNGVVLRSEQRYDCHEIKDLHGNACTYAWNPRGCLNGFTFQRRMYGPYRLRHPIVRKGWKAWAEAGFPDLDEGANRSTYKFDSRGTDEFLRIEWNEAYRLLAKAAAAIARRYSGDAGKKRMLAQGVPEEMLAHWEGAGTRTFKLRGGMGLLGVLGKYGMYRVSNTLSLLDAHVRKVGPKEAKGGRLWSNYTWHGDQAPGFPFVHGLQSSECDFNDLRFTKLHVQIGKNLVENKRPESHFFIECMERGATIVTIAPEYSPPATKSDYWIPIRPATDAALLLGVSRIIIEKGWYDAAFLKGFTDFPLLIRTDNLQRLKASDAFPGYKAQDISKGASLAFYGMTPEQRDALGDFVVKDSRTGKLVAITRDDVGEKLAAKGIDPVLEGAFDVTLADGKTVKVVTLLTAYKDYHLKDYDLDTVSNITHAPREMLERLAHDLATIKPAAIHIGEGLNHWFHAVETNRAACLPVILTGNIGKPGSGCQTWAGNYKAGLFQASHEAGPGFKGWVAEDPFEPLLDPAGDPKKIKVRPTTVDEEPAYWNYGDQPLIVQTPGKGKKCFTGKSHMPTPTRFLMFTNVNLINNAKWAYEMIKNVDPLIEMIVSIDIELNASVEYSDMALPASSWMEMQTPEITASCSNPFVQIWKGGMKPVYDTRDDQVILAQIAGAIGDEIVAQGGDPKLGRLAHDYWKFIHEGRAEVYIDRLLSGSMTLQGYTYKDIMDGKYGVPGTALFLFRSYPRVPFYEQVADSLPFFTPTGRLQAYNDEPEVIEYGENFIVHREGPEATPFLPNVIVSSNPLVRPEDYGIPADHVGAGERQVRNIKMPWAQVRKTKNPLWEAGFRFFCLTPKTRHSTHSSWQTVDWHQAWSSQFGDPFRADKRSPGIGEHTLHINPVSAHELGLADGDYAYVDANPADRPYTGWKPTDPFYKTARLMLRVKYNPAYPPGIVMMKHAPWIATERSVKAHETRPDGRAVSAGTGYQAQFRYGSQQSITRGWLPPMHQTDTLFHKAKAKMAFILGGEADNHAVNTVPKETLVKVTKAEDGGLGSKGVWAPATSGRSPAAENPVMLAYLAGKLTRRESDED